MDTSETAQIRKLGIVGHAAEKFTPETETLARRAMYDFAVMGHPHLEAIVSGHSPMGGIDWWAEELAEVLGVEMIIHAPLGNSWGEPGGYRDRNLRIAEDSDRVLCVVVKELPPEFEGMRFAGCYHCKGRNPQHVKSGGCWTAWRCKRQAWRII